MDIYISIDINYSIVLNTCCMEMEWIQNTAIEIGYELKWIEAKRMKCTIDIQLDQNWKLCTISYYFAIVFPPLLQSPDRYPKTLILIGWGSLCLSRLG